MAAESHHMRLISHDKLAGFGNVGEGMSMQLTSTGRRILWLAHESAPKNFTGVDVTDPAQPKVDLPDRAAASQCALQLAGGMRRSDGGGVSDQHAWIAARRGRDVRHLQRPRRRVRSAFSTAPARRRAVCISLVCRRQDRVFRRRRAGFHAAQSARRPAVPRDRCERPDQTARDLPLVVSGRRRGRQRATAAAASEVQQRLARAQYQCLSGTAGPRVSAAISMAARSFSTSAISAHPKMVGALEPHPPFPALPTPRCRCSSQPADRQRRMRARRRRRLAQAGVGARHALETNLVCISTFPLPPVEAISSAAAATARITCMRTCRARRSAPTR